MQKQISHYSIILQLRILKILVCTFLVFTITSCKKENNTKEKKEEETIGNIAKNTALKKAENVKEKTTTPVNNQPFVTTWKTTKAKENIIIYRNSIKNIENYHYTVDWGDGTVDNITTKIAQHRYTTPNTYTVSITGNFHSIYNRSDKRNAAKLQTIENWGGIAWQSMGNAFHNCVNLTLNAKDVPNLTNVKYANSMFRGATSFNGDLSGWDVSNITRIAYMFKDATAFNKDISGWRFNKKLIDTNSMFEGATAFNQDISNWNMSRVNSMVSMFKGATNFNQNLSSWATDIVIFCDNFSTNSGLTNKNLPTKGACFK